MKRIACALLSIISLIVLAFAFGSCSSGTRAPGGKFTYSSWDDGETYAVGYDWDGKTNEIEEIKFPDTYQGKPITSISYFDVDPLLPVVERVIIPASVKTIGTEAFRDSWVNKVVFETGSQCTSILDRAFFGCEFLTECILPSTVTRIEDQAFYECRKLENFTIPPKVTEIKSETFRYCSSLKSLTVPEGVTSIQRSAFTGCGSLTSITLPETLQTIGEFAFEYCPLLSVILPEGLTGLGAGVFQNSQLTTITIPSSIERIANNTFNACNHLETVIFAQESSCTAIEENAFVNCTALTTIRFPDKVNSIGKNAFKNCTALTDITLPDALERLEEGAFIGCEGISTIRFGADSKCKFIGKDTFKNCNSLSVVYIEKLEKWCGIQFENNYSTPLYYASVLSLNGNSADFVIPKDVTAIPDMAFKNLSQLKTVTFEIGSKCKSIGMGAFTGCSSLQTVNFSSESVCTSIGASAFANCPSLKIFHMPVSVQKVGENAFYQTENLTQVTTTDIASWCKIQFANAHANPATKAQNLYYGNDVLRALTIPDTVAEIGAYAFAECKDLTSVTIPATVRKIGREAFESFYISMANIQDLSAWCTIELEDFTSNPVGKSTLHLNGEPLTNITIPASVQKINPYVFSGCFSLKTVRIEKDSVQSIGEEAFSGCSELTEIYIPFSVKTIGDYAFAECEKLTVYTQYLSPPSGWSKFWNFSNCPVKWDLFQ